jgi:hypothetical protein
MPIVVTIYRLTDKSKDQETLQLIAQERLIKEFVWQQDERTMPAGIITESDYSIEGAYVGDNPCEIQRIDDEDKITFVFNVPSGIDTSGLQSLEYRVKLPFEKESVLSLTHDFPTLNATVSFDWREVSEEIDTYVLTMAGIQDNPIPWDTDDKFVIKYKYRGWLNPQNGYVFVWWERK